jgi:hypothetical protein
VKYAEFVDPMEENGNDNIPVLNAAVSYQKFILLTVTRLAEVWHFCGTDYVCYNEILLH